LSIFNGEEHKKEQTETADPCAHPCPLKGIRALLILISIDQCFATEARLRETLRRAGGAFVLKGSSSPLQALTNAYSTEASASPAKKRGVRWACGRKHFFALTFFASFLCQDKKEENTDVLEAITMVTSELS